MSKNWGRTPVTNADKRFAAHLTYYVETPEGPMRRVDRRPLGRSEQFVDKDGNTCWIQMYGDGDSRKVETEQRNRANMHHKGAIEHAKCPIRYGTRQYAERDFSKMPAHLATECKSDPKPYVRLNYHGEPAKRGEPGDLYAGEACPHIEWLITFRREQAEKTRALLNPYAAQAEEAKKQEAELKRLQADLLKEQIAERQAKTSRSKKEPSE